MGVQVRICKLKRRLKSDRLIAELDATLSTISGKRHSSLSKRSFFRRGFVCSCVVMQDNADKRNADHVLRLPCRKALHISIFAGIAIAGYGYILLDTICYFNDVSRTSTYSG